MKSRVLFLALLGLAAVFPTRSGAHPLAVNSTMTYSAAQPSGGASSVANWTGAAFDAGNIGGSGVNADGGANNGVANDATTYVANNQPRQGQMMVTGANANGYDVASFTVRMAGYTNNTATGSNRTSWNLNPQNGPIIVEIGKVSGTAFTTVSAQLFMAGGTGNPGAGTSANGAGSYLTFVLPFATHLEPNTTYAFDLRIGNGSSNFFEWLGTSADAFASGAAYTRSGAVITPLAGDRVFQVNMTASASAPPVFAHPGTLHTSADLARMAAKVAGNAQPWKSDYDILAGSPYAQTSWGSYNVDYINRGGAGANNYTRSQQDAQAIYELALRWHITGNAAYADRAVAIANVWNDLLGVTGDSNQSLAGGICGYLFAVGGDLLSTYPGWAAADKAAYKAMMMRVFYPSNFDFLWRKHGTAVNDGGNTHYRLNWDTANIASMAAIGVLCDNRAVYEQALDFFKYGAANGRAERAAWFIHPNGLAQGEEAGRDQGHNIGGWMCMSVLLQTAWNQGDDLFAWDNNRVLRTYEYNAKHNLGFDVPYTRHRNSDIDYTEGVVAPGTGFVPCYELIYNHYVNVKGIAAPWSKLAAASMRPEDRPHTEYHPSQVDWFGLGTLTHTLDPIAAGVAPGGLVAHWTKNKITLNWWGSAYATSYHIKRATVSGGPYTVIGMSGETDTFFTDANVANNGVYFYAVSANTPTGETANSPELRVARELVTHFTFENTLNDLVGTRHGAGIGGSTGAPGFAAGKTGQAVSFDGVDDFVQLPANSGVYQDITVAAWVYWNGGGTWQRVFDFGSEQEKYLMLTVNAGSNLLRFQMSTTRGADGTLTLTGPAMPTATWTHVALTLNGDTATLYVNGAPVTAAATDLVDPLFGQPYCYLGKSMFNSDALFSGRIDDFRIYNHALSGGDVYALAGVGGGNSAPQFTSDPLAKPNATEDAAYSQTLAGSATDANGGTLTFSKISGPSWLSVASNGALTGTPSNADVGENLFVVRVTDPGGATDDANLFITVGNVNDAPTWNASPITKPAVTRDQPYAFALATLAGDAGDVDAGDALTFSKIGGPAWLVVAANGALSGTPGAGDVGANVFTVRATDSAGAFADATLNIAVLGFGLRTHLLFENNTADALGNASGTANGSPVFIAGRTAQSIVLDGADDVVTLPDGALNYQDITVATWVYWDGGAQYQRIFDFGDDTNQYCYLSPNSGGNLRFAIKNGGSEGQVNAAALATGRWVHVAVTLGGDTATLYVNGAAAATNAGVTIDPDDFRPSLNFIGDSQFSADPLFAGKLDDFRIYNYALSAAEITALLDLAPAPPSGLFAVPKSGRIDLTWLASQGAQTYTVKRSLTSGSSFSTVISGLTAASYSDTGLTNGTPYFYIVTATNPRGESNASPENSATPIDLLVHLRFDETSGTSAADSSGNGFTATLFNGPVFAAGKIDSAIVFDGANDYAALPAGVANVREFTIAAWVWWNGGATSQRIFSFGDDTSNFLNLSPSASAGKLKFGIRSGGATEQQLLAAAPLATASWQHVAVTLAGGAGTLYVNGTVAATGAISFTPADFTPSLNYLGKSVTASDPYFSGKVDDFRLYTRALTAAEITAFQTPLIAPQNLTATPAPLAIALAWNAVPQAASYAVKTATVSGGPFTALASGITATSFMHGELAWGAARFYIVSATNITGESAGSAEASASPASPLFIAAEIRAPAIAFVPANGDEDAVYRFTSAASVIGHTYRLQTTGNLATGLWTDLGVPIAGTGAVLIFTAPSTPGEPARFFRLHLSR